MTETLAAVLAIHNVHEFECQYVGTTRAAKRYGKMRMFLLRRAHEGDRPHGYEPNAG